MKKVMIGIKLIPSPSGSAAKYLKRCFCAANFSEECFCAVLCNLDLEIQTQKSELGYSKVCEGKISISNYKGKILLNENKSVFINKCCRIIEVMFLCLFSLIQT